MKGELTEIVHRLIEVVATLTEAVDELREQIEWENNQRGEPLLWTAGSKLNRFDKETRP